MSETPRTTREQQLADYMVRSGQWTQGEAETRAWFLAAQLECELAEVRKDSERLDWLHAQQKEQI